MAQHDDMQHGLGSPGLREQKKARLRRDIEACALSDVLANGYDETTIELICQQVGISKKTFFNYFSSKEAALLGEREVSCTAEGLRQRLEERGETSYLDVVTAFISDALYPRSVDVEIMKLRSRVVTAIPQLAFRSRKDMVCVNKMTSNVVKDYLESHPESRVMPEQSVVAESVLAISTALNVARSQYLLTMCCAEDCDAQEVRELLGSYLDRMDEGR